MAYDLIIIGGGPGGYLAAERASGAGLSTLLFEERSLGGVCLNEGCIPTKTLLYSAKLFDGAAHGERYGVTAEGLKLDHARVVARKDKVVKTLVAGVKGALKACGAEVVNARAEITGRSADGFTVSANDTEYTAKRLLIATGSSPAVPPIAGLKEALEAGFAVTNRELLSLSEIPARLVVIGGGVIGLEMASYFRTAGSEVTVIEMLDHIAGENDRELVSILQKGYEKKGIKFLTGCRVTSVGNGAVSYDDGAGEKTLEADKALLSIGRRANSAGIGLEAIGVLTERGAVVTDEHMRTNVVNVYAAGDVNGRSMLAHTAYREAEVAVNDMLSKRDRMNYSVVPSVIYTSPELASVGETEATAAAKGLNVSVIKLPMRFSGRYLAENEGGDGVFKLLVDNVKRTVVGAQALGSYASEFIVAAGMLVDMMTPVERIKEFVFPHPTVGEIIREAIFKYND